jgi:hypothetical protein
MADERASFLRASSLEDLEARDERRFPFKVLSLPYQHASEIQLDIYLYEVFSVKVMRALEVMHERCESGEKQESIEDATLTLGQSTSHLQTLAQNSVSPPTRRPRRSLGPAVASAVITSYFIVQHSYPSSPPFLSIPTDGTPCLPLFVSPLFVSLASYSAPLGPHLDVAPDPRHHYESYSSRRAPKSIRLRPSTRSFLLPFPSSALSAYRSSLWDFVLSTATAAHSTTTPTAILFPFATSSETAFLPTPPVVVPSGRSVVIVSAAAAAAASSVVE